MATVNAYLLFNGKCEAAFNFYKKVFNKEFSSFSRFGEMPPNETMPISEEVKNLVMHVSLPISKETILMGSDGDPRRGAITSGHNFSIAVATDNQQEADAIFKGLSEGGNVTMAMEKTFWGAYFGMLVDQFGYSWMVNCDLK